VLSVRNERKRDSLGSVLKVERWDAHGWSFNPLRLPACVLRGYRCEPSDGSWVYPRARFGGCSRRLRNKRSLKDPAKCFQSGGGFYCADCVGNVRYLRIERSTCQIITHTVVPAKTKMTTTDIDSGLFKTNRARRLNSGSRIYQSGRSL
jgi:hypothetical protein